MLDCLESQDPEGWMDRLGVGRGISAVAACGEEKQYVSEGGCVLEFASMGRWLFQLLLSRSHRPTRNGMGSHSGAKQK